MIKKILAVVLAVFMVLSLTACKKDIYNFQLVKDDRYYAISKVLDDKLEKAVIDSEHEGKMVVAILNRTFRSIKTLKEVHIPSNLCIIGADAFIGCSNLQKTNYIGDIEEWGYIEFANSGANPTSYSRDLYVNDNLITEINLQKATKINGYAFFNCKSIKTVNVGETVQSIGQASFANCVGLTSVNLSNSISGISDETFSNCQNLEKITFGENLFMIGNNAFNGCVKLEEISTLKKVSSIGDFAFYGCEKITSISLPSTLVNIGESAFYNTGIKTIIFDGTTLQFGRIDKVDGWGRGIEDAVIICTDGTLQVNEFIK